MFRTGYGKNGEARHFFLPRFFHPVRLTRLQHLAALDDFRGRLRGLQASQQHRAWIKAQNIYKMTRVVGKITELHGA